MDSEWLLYVSIGSSAVTNVPSVVTNVPSGGGGGVCGGRGSTGHLCIFSILLWSQNCSKKIKSSKVFNYNKLIKLIKIKINNSCNTSFLDAGSHDLSSKTMKMSIILVYAALPRG